MEEKSRQEKMVVPAEGMERKLPICKIVLGSGRDISLRLAAWEKDGVGWRLPLSHKST